MSQSDKAIDSSSKGNWTIQFSQSLAGAGVCPTEVGVGTKPLSNATVDKAVPVVTDTLPPVANDLIAGDCEPTGASIRTPAKPRRSHIKYVSKQIETIANLPLPDTTDNLHEKTLGTIATVEEVAGSGLMFMPLSAEKRKSPDNSSNSASAVRKNLSKKSRLVGVGGSVRTPTRVSAGKNPVQPRPINAAKARVHLTRTAAVATIRRAGSNTRLGLFQC